MIKRFEQYNLKQYKEMKRMRINMKWFCFNWLGCDTVGVFNINLNQN